MKSDLKDSWRASQRQMCGRSLYCWYWLKRRQVVTPGLFSFSARWWSNVIFSFPPTETRHGGFLDLQLKHGRPLTSLTAAATRLKNSLKSSEELHGKIKFQARWPRPPLPACVCGIPQQSRLEKKGLVEFLELRRRRSLVEMMCSAIIYDFL